MGLLRRFATTGAAVVLLTAAALAQNAPSEDVFTTSDGVKIHYLTTGTSGSWVVLIHGYTDNAEHMWFRTGIALALAARHRVVALDNRNHGKSDKPQPGGPGRAQDVVELMDHLHIERAHIHGYSMGGAMTGQLLTMIPQRFITAGFGGSGIQEVDPKLREQAAALDAALPKPQGAMAAAMDRFRERMAQARPTASTPTAATGPRIDLTKLTVPILAVNGSFDSPYTKTQRLWREAHVFENVILADQTHLSAISSNGAPPLYIESITRFIDAHDEH